MVDSKNRNHHRNYGCGLVEVALSATPWEHGARNVRIGPNSDSCTAANRILFDHLVGAHEDRR